MESIERFLLSPCIMSGYVGSGASYGSGSGFGSGAGSGSGDGSGILTINGNKVYNIDGIPTIIYSVRGNLAKGAILYEDLTLKECFIARSGNSFAHGDTAKKAIEEAQQKELEVKPVEERINDFISQFDLSKKYSGNDFYKWHTILTGSCTTGKNSFIQNNNIDLNKKFTVSEFINICKDAYGASVIRQLQDRIQRVSNN